MTSSSCLKLSSLCSNLGMKMWIKLLSPACWLCISKICTFHSNKSLSPSSGLEDARRRMTGQLKGEVCDFSQILKEKITSNGYFNTAAIHSMVPCGPKTLPLLSLLVKYGAFSFILDALFEDASAQPNYKTCCQECWIVHTNFGKKKMKENRYWGYTL